MEKTVYCQPPLCETPSCVERMVDHAKGGGYVYTCEHEHPKRCRYSSVYVRSALDVEPWIHSDEIGDDW